jgi:hypothetical protein
MRPAVGDEENRVGLGHAATHMSQSGPSATFDRAVGMSAEGAKRRDGDIQRCHSFGPRRRFAAAQRGACNGRESGQSAEAAGTAGPDPRPQTGHRGVAEGLNTP